MPDAGDSPPRFAASLGALLGLWFGHVFSGSIPGVQASRGVFAIADMAALFALTVSAPITGIALGGRPIYTVLLERTLSAAAAPRSAPQSAA